MSLTQRRPSRKMAWFSFCSSTGVQSQLKKNSKHEFAIDFNKDGEKKKRIQEIEKDITCPRWKKTGQHQQFRTSPRRHIQISQ